MRVLDLLQLLQDYPRRTPVFVRTAAGSRPFADFALRSVDEQAQLLLTPKTAGKPLQCWELMLLIDKPEWRQAFVYLAEADDVRPLFGCQEQPRGLVLN